MALLPFVLLCLVIPVRGYAESPTQLVDTIPQGDSLYLRLIDSSFVAGNIGNYAKADTLLQQAIAIHPRHPMTPLLLNNLGGVQQLEGKYKEALESFSQALEYDPDNRTIRSNRARLYALVGEHKKATTDYSLLVSVAPQDELYRYQRAMSYMLSGDLDLAETDLHYIIDHNPSTLKARVGYALLQTLQGKYDEAERLYAYLVDKLPRNSEVYEGRARLYLLKGMRGYALRDIDKAVEYAGAQPSPSVYSLRAEIYRAVGDTKEAERSEKRADELRRSCQ